MGLEFLYGGVKGFGCIKIGSVQEVGFENVIAESTHYCIE